MCDHTHFLATSMWQIVRHLFVVGVYTIRFLSVAVDYPQGTESHAYRVYARGVVNLLCTEEYGK